MATDSTKTSLRNQIRLARNAAENRTGKSLSICQRLVGADFFQTSAAVAFYASIRSEVETHELLYESMKTDKRVSVPFVAADDLELFEVQSPDELRSGSFGVLEPSSAVRNNSERRVDPASVNLIVVPGMAFDKTGGRLGYGRGFYDRLLATATNATFVALAFECQIVDRVPVTRHDVGMHFVVTESRTIRCETA